MKVGIFKENKKRKKRFDTRQSFAFFFVLRHVSNTILVRLDNSQSNSKKAVELFLERGRKNRVTLSLSVDIL